MSSRDERRARCTSSSGFPACRSAKCWVAESVTSPAPSGARLPGMPGSTSITSIARCSTCGTRTSWGRPVRGRLDATLSVTSGLKPTPAKKSRSAGVTTPAAIRPASVAGTASTRASSSNTSSATSSEVLLHASVKRQPAWSLAWSARSPVRTSRPSAAASAISPRPPAASPRPDAPHAVCCQ